jgi:hypothetical protein
MEISLFCKGNLLLSFGSPTFPSKERGLARSHRNPALGSLAVPGPRKCRSNAESYTQQLCKSQLEGWHLAFGKSVARMGNESGETA